jgi:hypothetical protein
MMISQAWSKWWREMALTDNLISYWKLDESSGSRADSHGFNTLTDSGSVGSATGKLRNAADFDGTNKALSHADNADLSMGDIDMSLALWLYPKSVTTVYDILGKWGATEEYILIMLSSGALRWYVDQGAGTNPSVTTSATLSVNTWYHIVCYHDAAANQLGIVVNAGTPDTLSWSQGIYDGTTDFIIGKRSGGSAYCNARVDSVGLWKRVLTSQERTDLYNGGAGLEYPFTGSSPGALGKRRRSSIVVPSLDFELTW